MAAPALKRADVRAFVGTTGSGKGVGVNEALDGLKPSRLVIFDPLKEYGDRGIVVSDVRQAIAAMKKPGFKIVWQPHDDTDFDSKEFKAHFAALCKVVFMVGDLVFVVEELELVTRPTWAPAAWRNCTKRGRHQRLVIIAACQRPADADKAFWSSCMYIRCHNLRESGDKDRMAKVLDVSYEVINGLKTIAVSDRETHITYYEKDFNRGTMGQVTNKLRR